MTKKTDLTIYREARVERRFPDPLLYWVSIPEIGVRKIVIGKGEKALKLGQSVRVWWHRGSRVWIKKG